MAKKRGNGEGSIRKRPNGLWEARYVSGFDENKKPIRKSIYGKTQKEVREKLQAVANSINNGSYIPPDSITVEEWSKIWIEKRLQDVKASTREQYDGYLRNHVLPEIGQIQMQKVTPLIIQNLLDKGTSDGLSAKSVHNLCGILHHLFQNAVNDKIIRENPAVQRTLPKVQKSRENMIILEGDKLKEFLNEIKGKPYADEFFVALFTGMREGELLGLTWDCIDFKKNTIVIDKQLKRDRRIGKGVSYVVDSTKTGSCRTITVATSVMTVLHSVKRKQMENQLKYGSAFTNENNFVFTNEIGMHRISVSMWKHFKKRVQAIGLPDMRFHDLRHTCASLMLQNGEDLKTVSEFLGHTTIATTANVYAHLTEKLRKDSANRMEAFIQAI